MNDSGWTVVRCAALLALTRAALGLTSRGGGGSGGTGTVLDYAVSTDTWRTSATSRAPVSHTPPPVADVVGTPVRLRFLAPGDTSFVPPGGGSAAKRNVYVLATGVRFRF